MEVALEIDTPSECGINKHQNSLQRNVTHTSS